MNNRVLFVDDDQNILLAYRRQLRKLFRVETALGGEEGLAKIHSGTPYAVVISDMRMPHMDGIQFLSHVREQAPDTVRMMLTGFADVKTTMEAVNEGHIFRFLTKPCSLDMLEKAIRAGIKQYQLQRAEKELLEQTLRGSIKVLTEVLGLVNPEAFGRSSRIKRLARNVALRLQLPDVWRIETAAMLSQIGCVILPENTLKKIYLGQRLTDEEKQLFAKHPQVGATLLAHIPRFKEISEMIACQEFRYKGGGTGQDSRKGEDIPVGARILKVVSDFDLLEAAEMKRSEAINQMAKRTGWYDPQILSALKEVIDSEITYEVKKISLSELSPNMILAEDIVAVNGPLLMSRGQEISSPLIARLKNFARFSKIKEPFGVMIPIKNPPAPE